MLSCSTPTPIPSPTATPLPTATPTPAGPVVPDFAITTNPYEQAYPAISGNIVVWQDRRNEPDDRCREVSCNYDIYGKDLATGREFPVVTQPAHQGGPAISGNIVVWTDERNGYQQTYGQDLTTGQEFPVGTQPAWQAGPAISGNIVVWEDWRNGIDNLDVYGKDLSTGAEFAVTTNPDRQMYPAISGNIVVWMDIRNGNGDIYGARLEWASPTPTPSP